MEAENRGNSGVTPFHYLHHLIPRFERGAAKSASGDPARQQDVSELSSVTP